MRIMVPNEPFPKMVSGETHSLLFGSSLNINQYYSLTSWLCGSFPLCLGWTLFLLLAASPDGMPCQVQAVMGTFLAVWGRGHQRVTFLLTSSDTAAALILSLSHSLFLLWFSLILCSFPHIFFLPSLILSRLHVTATWVTEADSYERIRNRILNNIDFFSSTHCHHLCAS